MDRKPAVAGSFYPGGTDELDRSVRTLMGDVERADALGVVSPHAGYMYSGAVAGQVLGGTVIPDICVILAPNHTGMGRCPFAVWPDGCWAVPTGSVPVDGEFCNLLIEACDDAEEGRSAHLEEHSAEVQVPFLLAANPSVRIVPVVVSTHDIQRLRNFGTKLAGVISETEDQVLVIASSDMTHQESRESAGKKDRMAIDRILALDEEGLLETVSTHSISMCGVAPTVSMIRCCRDLGATTAELVDYRTSGDVTGDDERVVGYAGLVIR